MKNSLTSLNGRNKVFINGKTKNLINLKMNMSYCRFENTLGDIRDCEANLFDDLEGREFRARKKLVEICVEIAKCASQVMELEEAKE